MESLSARTPEQSPAHVAAAIEDFVAAHPEAAVLEDGKVAESRVLTDRFIPVIRAWDMTPGSATLGQILTIR